MEMQELENWERLFRELAEVNRKLDLLGKMSPYREAFRSEQWGYGEDPPKTSSTITDNEGTTYRVIDVDMAEAARHGWTGCVFLNDHTYAP